MHVLIGSEILELACNCIVIFNVELVEDLKPIFYENSQEYSQYDVDKDCYFPWIVEPHEEEGAQMEEEELKNKENKAIGGLNFHVFNCFVH